MKTELDLSLIIRWQINYTESKAKTNGYPLKHIYYMILTKIIPRNIYTHLIFHLDVQSIFEVILKFLHLIMNSGSQPQENPGSQSIAIKVIKLKCLSMSYYEYFVPIVVFECTLQIDVLRKIYRL